mgnify:CR=1 FL=1
MFNELNNKTILITGGTGSFGKKFIELALKKSKPKKIIIYSRDEQKQFQLRQKISSDKIRYFIGDIRDKQRLEFATRSVDYILHAAALKHVEIAEYNPFEVVKTNILGSQNLIESALKNNVKKVIALSTDKASSPLNLYGSTKLTSDKLFVSANNFKGNSKTIFSVVRYGNVMGSRGSVIPLFLKQKQKNIFSVTNKDMTRFNISLYEGVEFVVKCLRRMIGGEIFVPRIMSYKILDLVKSISPRPKIKLIGTRSGEKIDEEMISTSEAVNTVEGQDCYIILPNSKFNKLNKSSFLKKNKNFKSIKKNFSYNSRDNKFLSIQQLKVLIERNNKDFEKYSD